MREVGYSRLLDDLCREGFGDSRNTVNVQVVNEAWNHEDFTIPQVMRTSLGGRCVLIVEGEREIVGPIVAHVRETVADAINGRNR